MYSSSFDGELSCLLRFIMRKCKVNTLLSVHLVYEEIENQEYWLCCIIVACIIFSDFYVCWVFDLQNKFLEIIHIEIFLIESNLSNLFKISHKMFLSSNFQLKVYLKMKKILKALQHFRLQNFFIFKFFWFPTQHENLNREADFLSEISKFCGTSNAFLRSVKMTEF